MDRSRFHERIADYVVGEICFRYNAVPSRTETSRNAEVPRDVFFCSKAWVYRTELDGGPDARKGGLMPRLFLTNIPCDCEDAELRGWIEAQGFDVDSV